MKTVRKKLRTRVNRLRLFFFSKFMGGRKKKKNGVCYFYNTGLNLPGPGHTLFRVFGNNDGDRADGDR